MRGKSWEGQSRAVLLRAAEAAAGEGHLRPVAFCPTLPSRAGRRRYGCHLPGEVLLPRTVCKGEGRAGARERGSDFEHL